MSIEKYEIDSFKKQEIPFDFTILPNIVLQNFTHEALSIWVHLMSLPPDWEVNRAYLMNKFNIGRDKLNRFLKVLINNHLMEYERIRESDGTVKQVVIIIKNGSEFYKKVVVKEEVPTTSLKTRKVDTPINSTENPTSSETTHYKRNKLYNKTNIVLGTHDFVLPEWLQKDDWLEFLQHRQTLKSPLSPLAQKRAINALSKLRTEGNDASEVINQSIVNGWKGLFAIIYQKGVSYGRRNRSEKNKSLPPEEHPTDRARREYMEALERERKQK